jgi:integrase
MSLRVYSPGTRKGNRFCIIRGRLGGRLIEITTDTTDKGAAEETRAKLEYDFYKGRPVARTITFAQAADLYEAFKAPGHTERQRIARLVKAIGTRKLRDVRQDTLVEAAAFLYPTAKPSSKNRSVIAPGAAILHYATRLDLVDYRRIERFKEPAPVTRALSREAADALMNTAKGDVKNLLVWLFHQGTRITDALRVKWDDVDLKARTVRMRVSKADEWRIFPLAQEVFFRLANAPKREGYLFPWRNRWAAYGALEPVLKATKIKFTPHMARHSLGTWLNARGVGGKTIMSALGHKDRKSSDRYQHADVEIVRAALDGVVGTDVGRRRKRK